MTQVLIGTTNPAKVEWFKNLFSQYDVQLISPDVLGISGEPEEIGVTPEEIAVGKAQFYGAHFDRVVCGDSGLYFDGLALNDARQPGLHARTPGGLPRLSDEDMIVHYTSLISHLGGRVRAYYLNGMAACFRGQVWSVLEEPASAMKRLFYMVDRPSPRRRPGWPLDSISVNPVSGKYYVDDIPDKGETGENSGLYWQGMVQGLANALQLHGWHDCGK